MGHSFQLWLFYFTELFVLGCSSPVNPYNSTIINSQKARETFYLSGDVIKYSCDEGYKFVNSTDETNEFVCSNGNWNIKEEPICIKGMIYEFSLFYTLRHQKQK